MTHTITIVGLGNYGLDELPLGIYRFLIQQPLVYTRTLDHPVINQLQDELKFESFDTIYEKNEDFDSVYQQIVDVLIEKAQSQDVVYAVPGHPRVAETTTAKLLDYNDHHQDVNVKMLGGKSFIDDIFAAINQDPNDGFTLLDGTALTEQLLNVRTHTLITQVYSAMVAADIKITLMEHYPDDFPVKIVTSAHSTGSLCTRMPLFELDHHEDAFNNLTSVYVPKVTNDEVLYRNFDYAVEIIDRLVDDETGCPWDRVQTHASSNAIYWKKALNYSKQLIMKMIGT